MLSSIIQGLDFKAAEQAISGILIAEEANQQTLLLASGKTQQQIDNDYKFNVKRGLFYPKDAGELPLVSVYFASASVEDEYTDKTRSTYGLFIDLYAARKEAIDGTDVICQDTGANDRLDYLLSQVYHIIQSEQNYYKGFSSVYEKCRYKTFQKVGNQPEGIAVAVLMGRMIFDVEFNDSVEFVEPFDIKSFLISLELDGKTIDDILITK